MKTDYITSVTTLPPSLAFPRSLLAADVRFTAKEVYAIIYDRILERCAPILFAEKNFREDNAASTKTAARGIVTPD